MELRHRLELSICGGPAIGMTTGQPKFLMSPLGRQRELEEALRPLHEDFDAWKKGEVSVFDLSDQIHKFHDGRSRELFKLYSGSVEAWWIAHAVARGVIDESALSDDLRAELNEDIEVFRERLRGVDRPADSD